VYVDLQATVKPKDTVQATVCFVHRMATNARARLRSRRASSCTIVLLIDTVSQLASLERRVSDCWKQLSIDSP
jgi:hypothetical protein